MRSIIAFRGSQALSRAAFARRWNHNLQTSSAKVCHRRHRVDIVTRRDDAWHHSPRSLPQHHRCISATPSLLLSSTPDSFHGINLPNDEEKEKEKEQIIHQASSSSSSPPKNIQEAEVVTTEEDKQRTRELIKEATRAEMSAHSTVAKSEKKGKSSTISDGVDDDDDALNENNEAANSSSAVLGPYERRLQQLKQLQANHQTIDQQNTSEHAQSCINIGELHYHMGHMEESQEQFMTALKELMADSDGEGNRKQMMIAISMHVLGAIHSRCGEWEEASRWYEQSLKNKQKVIKGDGSDGDDGSSSMFHRHELGKTYNGMAALEVMKGGDVPWEKAMGLFQEAERNFLYGYEVQEDVEGETGDDVLGVPMDSLKVSKASMQKMTPRHAELVISVRSNMGELFIQQGKHDDAVQTLRSALNMARMALENEMEKEATALEGGTITETPLDGPSLDEQGSTIVDLLVKIADTLISANKFDEAAAGYEQALTSHVLFRRWSEEINLTRGHPASLKRDFPATTAGSTKIKLDLKAATTVEAAIRNNLAHALAQIGQDNIALEQYEASLKIIRHIGGDFHMEVAHTLMGMGALLGGPIRDFPKGLNCFKEALYIFRSNLKELREEKFNSSASLQRQSFFGDEDEKEIDGHIQNALKNINLIDAAMAKDRDGASKKRRP